jgi:outer membrane protein
MKPILSCSATHGCERIYLGAASTLRATLRALPWLLLSLIPEGAYAGSLHDGNPKALSLADCLSLARENNPVANQARERIHELVADYEATRAGFFPRLALTSYYQRLDQDRMPPGGFTPPGQRLFDQESLTTVSAKQTIFKGGRTYYGAQAATLGTEAQREESTRTTDEIAYTVTLAFFRLLESKENLRVATEALQQRQAFAAVTEAFFRAGNVTRLDYLRARSLVATAEQAEMEAGNAITQGRVILATAMGFRDEALADDLDVRGDLPHDPAPGPDLTSLWQAALRDSPEIKKLDLTLAQSQALIQAARGGYFPEVSVQGSVGLRHQEIAGTKGEWLIGAFLDFPFFEGGVTKAQVAKASSQRLQLEEQKRARLNTIKADLATAWRDQENARRGTTTAKQTVETNTEAYASAEALYRAGKAIALDVLQTQTDLTASRFSLVRYQVDYVLAQARIRQLVHGADNGPGKTTLTGSQAK